jgi:endonuclease YncB( thermonuclease family)
MARRVHVVEVIDGNTFKTEAHTVRLEGVDAPMLDQPGGLEAKRWMEWLLETGKIVTIEEKATDAEGRIIAQVWINSTDVNGTMKQFLSK